MFSGKRTRIIAATAAAIVLAGGSYAIVTATSGSASTPATTSSRPAGGFGSGGGSNARSGPAAGGSSGTISSVSSSGFTLTTASRPEGDHQGDVLHHLRERHKPGLGQRRHHRRTASWCWGPPTARPSPPPRSSWQPPSSSASSPGGQVIALPAGRAGLHVEQVGQIPAELHAGVGDDRQRHRPRTRRPRPRWPPTRAASSTGLCKLSNGQYEVHYIGVNWPHHIFVNQDFQVIGADD